MKWVPVVLCAALMQAAPAYSQIYKCTVNGQLVFTDRPCDDAEVVELSTTNSSQATVAVGYKSDSKRYSGTTWYKGASGYRDALRTAERYGAPMILYFRVDWCGFCRDVERYLFPVSEAVNAMRPFVKVEVDPEKSASSKALFDDMGLRGYPTFMVKRHEDRFRRMSLTRSKTADNPRRNISSAAFAEKLAAYTPPPPPPRLSSAEDYHARAMDYLEKGDFKLALNDTQSAIDLAPDTFAHYKLLDDILVRSRDWEQIRLYWNRYLQLVPDDAAAYVERSGTNYHDGKFDAALEDAKTAADLGSEEGRELYDSLLSEQQGKSPGP